MTVKKFSSFFFACCVSSFFIPKASALIYQDSNIDHFKPSQYNYNSENIEDYDQDIELFHPIKISLEKTSDIIYAFSFNQEDHSFPQIYKIEKIFEIENYLEFDISAFTKKEQEKFLSFNDLHWKCFPVAHLPVSTWSAIKKHNLVIFKLAKPAIEQVANTLSASSPSNISKDTSVSTPPLSFYTNQDIYTDQGKPVSTPPIPLPLPFYTAKDKPVSTPPIPLPLPFYTNQDIYTDQDKPVSTPPIPLPLPFYTDQNIIPIIQGITHTNLDKNQIDLDKNQIIEIKPEKWNNHIMIKSFFNKNLCPQVL